MYSRKTLIYIYICKVIAATRYVRRALIESWRHHHSVGGCTLFSFDWTKIERLEPIAFSDGTRRGWTVARVSLYLSLSIYLSIYLSI